MNLASFVNTCDSYETFHTLLEYLLSFYNNTIKADTSIFLVSGASSAGKSTIIKLLQRILNRKQPIDNTQVLCKYKPTSGLLDYKWLRDYPVIRPHSGSPFEQDLAVCSRTENFVETSVVRTIDKFHKVMNNPDGISYRKLYEECRYIQNPAVLLIILQTSEPVYYNPNKRKEKRKIKQLFLPNRFKCDTMNPETIITRCIQELDEIYIILDILKTWLKFTQLYSVAMLDHIGECVSDISTHFLHVILCNVPIKIPKEWWIIILQHEGLQRII